MSFASGFHSVGEGGVGARSIILQGLVSGFVLAMASGPGLAHKIKTKTIALSHPWVRVLPAGASATGAFAKISNTGAVDDRLIGASIAGAKAAAIHAGGAGGAMETAAAGIVIPAGGVVTLSGDGGHIMFSGIEAPLAEETYVAGSLTFEKAGRIEMEFYVEPAAESGAGSTPPAHRHE